MDLPAGASLLSALGLSVASTDAAVEAALCDDRLFVKHEDGVLGAVVWLACRRPMPPAVWRCVRVPYLSAGALAALHAGVQGRAGAGGSGGVDDGGAPSQPLPHRPTASVSSATALDDAALAHMCIPQEMTREIAQQVAMRSERRADARLASARFGALAVVGGGGATPPVASSPTPASAVARRPRDAYAFTCDVHGASHLGRGAGLFFVWVDPRAPTANNHVGIGGGDDDGSDDAVKGAEAGPSGGSAANGMPLRYRANVAAWGAAYGTQPTVFNGAQCLQAVREAACHPEFASRAVAGRGAGGLRSAGGGSAVGPTGLPVPAPPGSCLLELYTRLAGTGGWIQCVDIARLAILWLAGGGSAYLDTDMGVGPTRLPRSITVHDDTSAWDGAPGAGTPGGRLASSSPRPAHCVATPLLVLGQDADGQLQNNFLGLAGGGPAHPFLTLALTAVVLSGGPGGEAHVIKATGPALLTAVATAFRDAPAQASPSMLLAPPLGTDAAWPGGWTLCRAAAVVAAVFNGPDGAGAAAAAAGALPPVVVPAAGSPANAAVEATRVALPAPLPDTAFPFLASVPRAAGMLPLGGAWGTRAASAGATGGGDPTTRPLSALRIGDCVHACPPATFYPRHWRDPPAERAGGEGEGMCATAMAAAAATALQSADRAAQALMLRQLSEGAGAQGGADSHVSGEPAGATSTAAPARHPPAVGNAAAWTGGAPAPRSSDEEVDGGLAVMLRDAAVARDAATPHPALPPPQHPASGWEASAAVSVPQRYGVHGWDCTWAHPPAADGAAEGGYAYASAVGGNGGDASTGSSGGAGTAPNAGDGDASWAHGGYGDAAAGYGGYGGALAVYGGYGGAVAGYGGYGGAVAAFGGFGGYGSALLPAPGFGGAAGGGRGRGYAAAAYGGYVGGYASAATQLAGGSGGSGGYGGYGGALSGEGSGGGYGQGSSYAGAEGAGSGGYAAAAGGGYGGGGGQDGAGDGAAAAAAAYAAGAAAYGGAEYAGGVGGSASPAATASSTPGAPSPAAADLFGIADLARRVLGRLERAGLLLLHGA